MFIQSFKLKESRAHIHGSLAGRVQLATLRINLVRSQKYWHLFALMSSLASAAAVQDDSQETLELGTPDPEVTLEHEWTIRTNLHKKSWTVKQSDAQEVKNMKFIQLSKRDRNFVYFCTGKGLALARKTASMERVKPILETEGLTRKPREEDKDILPRAYVKVLMPAFDWDAGVVGPLEANMLWSLKAQTCGLNSAVRIGFTCDKWF